MDIQVKNKIVGKDLKGFLKKMAQEDDGISIGVAAMYHFTIHEYPDFEKFCEYWMEEVEVDDLMAAINTVNDVITPKLEKFNKVTK